MHPNPNLINAANCPQTMAAAQERGLAAARTWRALPMVRALSQCLDELNGDPPESVDALAERLTMWVEDRTWLDSFFETQLDALAEDPLTAIQFRLIQGRVAHGLLLLHRGSAEVTVNWIDGVSLPTALDRHILFTSALSVVVVLRANGLRARRYCLGQNGETMQAGPAVSIADGQVLAIDCRTDSLSMTSADGDAVVLRFNLSLPSAEPQRAFACDTGRPMGAAMGDDGASRMLPLLSLARLCGNAPAAAAVLAGLVGDRDPTLRWAAMREFLIADTALALPALRMMADQDDDDAVRSTAVRTLKLLTLKENQLCPV